MAGLKWFTFVPGHGKIAFQKLLLFILGYQLKLLLNL